MHHFSEKVIAITPSISDLLYDQSYIPSLTRPSDSPFPLPIQQFNTLKMLQRTILRQRRAVFSSINRASVPSSALRQTSPFQQLALKQSSFRFTPRSYSTENGTKTEDAKKENGEGAEKAAESPEDAIKKELEAKNKEVVELKVCQGFRTLNVFGTDRDFP